MATKDELREYAEDMEKIDGPDWKWFSCNFDGCSVCNALREEFPDREDK